MEIAGYFGTMFVPIRYLTKYNNESTQLAFLFGSYKIFFVSAETINQIFFMRGSLGHWVTMLCTPLIPNQVSLKINSASLAIWASQLIISFSWNVNSGFSKGKLFLWRYVGGLGYHGIPNLGTQVNSTTHHLSQPSRFGYPKLAWTPCTLRSSKMHLK